MRDALRQRLIDTATKVNNNTTRIQKLKLHLQKLCKETDVPMETLVDKGTRLAALTSPDALACLKKLDTCIKKREFTALIDSFADVEDYHALAGRLRTITAPAIHPGLESRGASTRKLTAAGVPTLVASKLLMEVLLKAISKSKAGVRESMEFLDTIEGRTNSKTQPVTWVLDEAESHMPRIRKEIADTRASLEAYLALETEVATIQSRLETLADDICGSAQPYQMSMLHAYFTIVNARKECEEHVPKLLQFDALSSWDDTTPPQSILFMLDYSHESTKEAFKRFERSLMSLQAKVKALKKEDATVKEEIGSFMIESKARFEALENMCHRNRFNLEQLQGLVSKEMLLLRHNHTAILLHVRQYHKQHRQVLEAFASLSDYDIIA